MGMTEARRTPPLPPPERRKAERLDLYAQVELRSRDEVMLLPVVNISSGGLLARNEGTHVETGGEVTVFLEANDISFTVEASVIRCDAMYIAVMFMSTDEEAATSLGKLLEYLESAR
jgi:hypothetical protein